MNAGDIEAFSSFVDAFCKAVGALGEIKGMEAENTHRQNNGLAIAYGDEAFDEVVTRYGLKVPS